MPLAYVEVCEPNGEQETFIEFVLGIFLSSVWNKQDILCFVFHSYMELNIFSFSEWKNLKNISKMLRMIFRKTNLFIICLVAWCILILSGLTWAYPSNLLPWRD